MGDSVQTDEVDREDGPGERAPERDLPGRLPVALSAVIVVLVVIGSAAVFSTGLRHQIALSLTRQRAPFVELFFPTPTAGLSPGCAREGGRPVAAFAVVGHLGEDRRLPYRVLLEPRQGAVRTLTGTVVVRQGSSVLVTRTAIRPLDGAYDVRVQLPDLGQQVQASCPQVGR